MAKKIKAKPSFQSQSVKEQIEELNMLLKAGLVRRPNAANPNAEYLLNKPSTPGTELGFPLAQEEQAGRVLITPSESLAVGQPKGLAAMKRLKAKGVLSKEVPAAGEAAAAGAGAMGGALGKLLKGGVGVALLSYLLNSGQEMAQELIRSKMEAGQMDLAQMATNPGAVQQQAMLPITRSQKQAALYMLMQRMGGGRQMLADGESMT